VPVEFGFKTGNVAWNPPGQGSPAIWGNRLHLKGIDQEIMLLNRVVGFDRTAII